MRRWLGSLRSRVFAATALVAVLPVALALGVVTRRAMRQAEADLARGLGEAARVVEQYHRARLDLAVERASLVADLPKLKAAVAEADAAHRRARRARLPRAGARRRVRRRRPPRTHPGLARDGDGGSCRLRSPSTATGCSRPSAPRS